MTPPKSMIILKEIACKHKSKFNRKNKKEWACLEQVGIIGNEGNKSRMAFKDKFHNGKHQNSTFDIVNS